MATPILHEFARARAALLACVALAAASAGMAAEARPLAITALSRTGTSLAAITDGDAIRLRATLARPAPRQVEIGFQLHAAQVGRCTIAPRATQCETAELRALGWYGANPQSLRTVTAASNTGGRATLGLRIAPRPVVLVHGFMASDKTWFAYTRAGGFLAAEGLAGYAVGDGQVEGTMNMGDPARLSAPTLTLPANAAALGRYIDGVKRITGAQMVDLVAHSMGGLVARYYVAQLMRERDVAQLVMLGTPHGGSDCSALPSALGVLAPASLELRPAYLRQIFNRTVTRRGGVPFHLLAGDPIVEAFKAPCTGTPSDLVVALDSVAAVPGEVSRLPVLHTDMTSSEAVFRQFVLPRLRAPISAFQRDSDRSAPGGPIAADSGASGQFTQVIKGRVAAGASTEIVVHLDDVAVASFALFDPTRSLTATVRGASGNVIRLNPTDHGLIRVDDPAAMVHLGYGFDRPRPGPWRVTLQAPAQNGAEFALSVRVIGGAVLRARASALSPTLQQSVQLSATFESPAAPLRDVAIEAIVHQPNGRSERIALRGDGAERSADWKPTQTGLHGIDVIARARTDELPIERTTLLAIDVRP